MGRAREDTSYATDRVRSVLCPRTWCLLLVKNALHLIELNVIKILLL